MQESGVEVEQSCPFSELATADFRILTFDQRMSAILRQRIMPDNESNASGERRHERPQPEPRTVRRRETLSRRSEVCEVDGDARIGLATQLESRGVHAAIWVDVVWSEAAVQFVTVGDGLKISQAVRPSAYRDEQRRNVGDRNIRALFFRG